MERKFTAFLVVVASMLLLAGCYTQIGTTRDEPSGDYSYNDQNSDYQADTTAGAGYGVWKGAGRTAARQVAGLIEVLTFPFPIWHNSYQPLLPSDIPYIHGGYAEFPPEVGNESKYPYVRDTHHDFN